MAFDTVADLLAFLKSFHSDLANFLDQMTKSWDDEKKRVILNFVGRHERNMAACIEDCAAELGRDVLRAWIKNVPQLPKCRCFEKITWQPSMSLNEVVARIQEVDACLLGLYRQLAEKAPTREVRELFEELLVREKTEGSRTLVEALSFLEQN